jgi:hypothetical protein
VCRWSSDVKSGLGATDDVQGVGGQERLHLVELPYARGALIQAPGGFQTGVNSLDLLGDRPIKQMAPSIDRN